MKKNFKIVFVIISLMVLLLPITYSYAIAQIEPNEKEEQFFGISKMEVTKNEKIEMTINLNSIKYNEFLFELRSDNVIENVEIEQSDEVSAEKNNNEIIMEINKEKMNIKTINLSYSIPENKKIGDTIKFIAIITNIANDRTEDSSENEEMLPNETTEKENTVIGNTEKSDKEIVEQPKQETQSIELEVKIIEEKGGNKPDDNKQDDQLPNKEDDKQNIQMPNKEDNKQDISTNYSNIQYSGSGNMSLGVNQEIKVTYNGSDNNYLSEILVEGNTLNKTFSKENTTYFMTIENDIETLDITALVEDSTATACVYGNENLKEGTNKILISVTAENGSVRNYRIYATKNN